MPKIPRTVATLVAAMLVGSVLLTSADAGNPPAYSKKQADARFAHNYCGLVRFRPASYDAGPCRAYARQLSATPLGTSDNVGSDSSIAFEADGYPIISFRDATSHALWVLKCFDVACGTSVETPIDVSGNNFDSSVAIGADGLPFVVYNRRSSATPTRFVHCNDVACASNSSGQLDTIVSDSSSLTMGKDGLPVVAYHSVSPSTLRVVKCTTADCSSSSSSVVDAGPDSVGIDPSIATGTDGSPVISYRDTTTPALKVAKCNDPACTGGDEKLSVVDVTGDDFTTSIGIGTDGKPVVAFEDASAGGIKVAKCNDKACSGSNEKVSTITTGANSGLFPSMTIGEDGFPVLSYVDATVLASPVLTFVHCNDAACSGSNETISPIGPSGLDSGTSIAIGLDGVPVISFEGATTPRTLWIARAPQR